MTVQAGLCRTWSETPKTVFLVTLIYYRFVSFPVMSILELFDNHSAELDHDLIDVVSMRLKNRAAVLEKRSSRFMTLSATN